MELSITEAAKQWGITRQKLHFKVKSGEVSRLGNGLIDSSEMIRFFGSPKTGNVKNVTPDVTPEITLYKLQLDNDILRQQNRLFQDSLKRSEEVQDRLLSQLENAMQTMKLLQHKPEAEPEVQLEQLEIKIKTSVWHSLLGNYLYIVFFVLALVVAGLMVAFLNGYRI